MRKSFNRSQARCALAFLVLAGANLAAQASPVTRSFEFSSTSGPLIFGANVGTFTYDSSIVPSGGGVVSATGLFSDLSVAFGSFSYDETTATTSSLSFDAAGELLEAIFGSNCNSFACSVLSGTNSWFMRVGTASVNDFQYALTSDPSNIFRTDLNRLLPLNSVPEPGSAALVLAAALAAAALRRKAQG